MTWQSTLESVATIDARDHWSFAGADQDRVAARVADWLVWYATHGQFPPGLVTPDGMLVDGHHRIRAARMLGVELPCCLVEPMLCRKNGKSQLIAALDQERLCFWRATGGVRVCR